MNCPACGTPIGPGDAFCPACGAPVATTVLPQVPAPQPSPVAPTQQMPQVPPPPPSAWAPDPSVPPQPGYPPQDYAAQPGVQPGAQPAAYPGAYGAAPAGAPKKGLSTGAIIGIVAGALVLLILLMVGGFFGIKAFRDKAADKAAQLAGGIGIVASDTAQPSAATPDQATGDDSGQSATDSDASSSDDEIITDDEARATVEGFLDARIARDVDASRKFCNNNFWNGEWHDALVDDTWRPETYEIVNTQPDLMYVHVVVKENWPSGDEYWIYSCLKDTSTGEPVIDGTLDPQNVPEMIP